MTNSEFNFVLGGLRALQHYNDDHEPVGITVRELCKLIEETSVVPHDLTYSVLGHAILNGTNKLSDTPARVIDGLNRYLGRRCLDMALTAEGEGPMRTYTVQLVF